MSDFYPPASNTLRHITVTLDDESAHMLTATTVAPTHALALIQGIHMDTHAAPSGSRMGKTLPTCRQPMWHII